MESLKLTWDELREAGVSEDIIKETQKAFCEGREWTLGDMFPDGQLPPQKLLDALMSLAVVDPPKKS